MHDKHRDLERWRFDCESHIKYILKTITQPLNKLVESTKRIKWKKDRITVYF